MSTLPEKTEFRKTNILQYDFKEMEKGLRKGLDGPLMGGSADDAALELADLKRSHKLGNGPSSMKEKRELAKEKKKDRGCQKD